MAFPLGGRYEFDDIREIGFADVTADWKLVGPVLSGPIRQITIKSSFDTNVYLSFDGVAKKKKVMANSLETVDITANSAPHGEAGELPGMGGIYIKPETTSPVPVLPTRGTLVVEILRVINYV